MQNKNIKISIIIPVYNGEGFVKKAYKSVLNQNLKSYELIFIDNNSKDNSVNEINEVMEKDSSIRFFHEKTQGSAAAKNRGIKEAFGDYVYLYDVDDQIFEGALKEMADILDKKPNIAAVFGKMYKTNQRMHEIEKFDNTTNNVVYKEKPYWGLHWLESIKNVVGTPAFLYRKKTFYNIGFFEEQLITGQDTAFDVRLGMQCELAYLDKYIYLYYTHPASISHVTKSKTDRVFMAWPRVSQSHLKFYLENDVPLQYKKLILRKVFTAMGRIIFLTKGVEESKKWKSKVLQDIHPLVPPKIILTFLTIFIYTKNELIYKTYIYKVVPYLINNKIDKL